MAILKLTRFVHSCLLAEADEAVAIFDPGIYSFESGLFDINKLGRLDYIAITHEHADHFHPPFIDKLLSKFPSAKIFTTEQVARLLSGKGSAVSSPMEPFQLFSAPHEYLPTGEPPQNIGIHFLNLLSHPGDSHSFSETKRILAMPMTAPWGSMTNAVRKIEELKPEVIMPIHDWHWKPEASQGMYRRISESLRELGINFILPIDGQAIEINLP